MCLNNLGGQLHAMGKYEQALPIMEEAFAMHEKLLRRLIQTKSELEALAYVQAQPLMRDSLLSLTLHVKNKDDAAYGAVFASKAAVTRVLEQRHAAARLAGSEQAAQLEQLRALNRRIDQLLQDRRLNIAERDRLLRENTEQRDRAEREIARSLPALQQAKELATLSPEALQAALPECTALIDFIRYSRFDFTPGKGGAGIRHLTPS
jgi:hypothetical protein